MNTSVIVSPACAFKALSSDDLRRCAPSVYAEHARPGVSSRYTFVSTAQVVALLGAEGWEPVKASEQRVRLEDRIGFQMHEIRFARRVDVEAGAFQVGSTRARNDSAERARRQSRLSDRCGALPVSLPKRV